MLHDAAVVRRLAIPRIAIINTATEARMPKAIIVELLRAHPTATVAMPPRPTVASIGSAQHTAHPRKIAIPARTFRFVEDFMSTPMFGRALMLELQARLKSMCFEASHPIE